MFFFGKTNKKEPSLMPEDRKIKLFGDVVVPENLKKYAELDNSLHELTENSIGTTLSLIDSKFPGSEVNYVLRKIIFFYLKKVRKIELYAQLYALVVLKNDEFSLPIGYIVTKSEAFAKKLYSIGAIDPISELADASSKGKGGMYAKSNNFGRCNISNTDKLVKNCFIDIFHPQQSEILPFIPPKNEFVDIIKNDNIDLLREKVADPGFSWKNFTTGHFIIADACENCAIKCFKFLLMNNVDIKSDNKIPHKAAFGGDNEIIHILEQNGVSFDNCILDAVKGYNLQLADYLINKGFKTKNYDIDKCFEFNTIIPFLFAVENRFFTISYIEEAIQNNCDHIVAYYFEQENAKKEKKKPILAEDFHLFVFAFENNNYDIVKKLIERGECDIEEKDNGITPLGFAVINRNMKLINLLLEKEAIVNPKSFNLPEIAIYHGTYTILKLLVDHGMKFVKPEIPSRRKQKISLAFLQSQPQPRKQNKKENTLLFDAVRTRNLEVFKLVYEHIEEKCSLIDLVPTAINEECPEILRFLIEQGADLTKLPQDKLLRTSNSEIIKLLVENKAALSDADVDSFYKSAANCWNLDAIKYMHEKGLKIPKDILKIYVNKEIFNYLLEHGKDLDIHYAMNNAIKNVDLETLKKIVDLGVDVNEVIKGDIDEELECMGYSYSRYGDPHPKDEYPLFKCLKYYRAEDDPDKYEEMEEYYPMIEYLLDKGAKVNVVAENGSKTIIEKAVKGSMKVFKLLAEKGKDFDANNESLVLKTINYGRIDIFNYLLGRGLDPNLVIDGSRIIYYVMNSQLDKFANSLLEHSLDVNLSIHASKEKSALSYAIKKCGESIIKEMIEKGAKINGIPGKKTPLISALMSYRVDVANILIDAGADISIPNPKTKTLPIFYIVSLNRGFIYQGRHSQGVLDISKEATKIIEKLISKGADLKVKDQDGKGLLFYAKTTELATFLLDKGLDPNEKCNNGMTPLHDAVICDNLSLAKLLIERGADPNIRDAPKTPADTKNYAIRKFFETLKEEKEKGKEEH